MYNYFMLIGYVNNELDIRKTSSGRSVLTIDLAVKRDFMNSDGTYTTDYVKVNLWTFLAEFAVERIRKGSKIGLKGRIRPKYVDSIDGYKIAVNELCADKVIFFDEPDDSKKVVSMDLPDDLPEQEE